MEASAIKIITEYGIGVGLVVVLCYISYKIIMYILSQSDNLMKLAMEQNAKWQDVINNHTAQAREFHSTSMEAFRRLREEHDKMMSKEDKVSELLVKHEEEVSSARVTLSSLNSQGRQEHERICKCLDDIIYKLKELNGKH